MLATSLKSHPPRRLLMVITDLDVGGAEKCCVELAERLDRGRWSVSVCSLMPAGRLADRLRDSGISVHSLGVTRFWQAPSGLVQLVQLLNRFQPSLVHSFLFHANVLARAAARLVGRPRVVSSIRVAEKRHRSHLVIENLSCRLSDRVVCVSDSVARFVRTVSHVPQSRVEIVPNGVAIDNRRLVAVPDRTALGLPRDGTVALYVGRLDEQKAVDVLLEAFAAVSSRVPDLQLAVAGAGPHRDQLKRQSSRLGVAARVVFLGWRPDVPDLLRAADFLVLPSRWEGMPNVVLEAMAARLPVVATRTEGTTELVRHESTGLLVPIDDSAALSHAIVRMASDVELRERCREQAHVHVAREYSMDRMVSRYEQIYEAVLSDDYFASARSRPSAFTL